MDLLDKLIWFIYGSFRIYLMNFYSDKIWILEGCLFAFLILIIKESMIEWETNLSRQRYKMNKANGFHNHSNKYNFSNHPYPFFPVHSSIIDWFPLYNLN